MLARHAGSIARGLHRLARHPARTGLTVVALGFSSAVVLTVAATIGSASQILTEFFAQYHANVFVTTPASPAAPVQAILDHVPGVDRVERFEQVQARTPRGDVIVTATEFGTRLYRYHMLSGRRLTAGEQEAALVSSSVAAGLGLRPGSEMTITSDGATERWRVIGVVLEENTHVGTLGAVFISMAQLHRLEGMPAGDAWGWAIGTHDRDANRAHYAGATWPGRLPPSVFLTETLCYAVLAWIVAAAIGVPAAAWLMRLISGGELLAWPFQPLAADLASERAATPALLALQVVTALLGAGPVIASARHRARDGSSLASERPMPGTSSSERGAQG